MGRFRGGQRVAPAREYESSELRAAVERVVNSHGLDLFDVQFRRESIGWVLRVIIDRRPPPAITPGTPEEPVGIDDCQRISQDLGALLDVEQHLTGGADRGYTLEVSSPGLDRSLRGEADYRRFEGRLAKIVTREPIERQTSFAGRLAGVEDGVIVLNEGRRTHRIPLALVTRGRLDVEF